MKENAYLKWLTGKTKTVYWHDSAVLPEVEKAILNGAAGVSTNPFLVNGALQSDPEGWRERIGAIPKDISPQEKAEIITHTVTGYLAKRFEMMYDYGKRGTGIVCAQVNPNKLSDVRAMVEQGKRYSKWGSNIAVKVPGTAAGLEVLEELVSQGINVAYTVSYSVAQVQAVLEAYNRASRRTKDAGTTPGTAFAVVMVGRLDDYLRDIVHDNKLNIAESDIIQAGTACAKRGYNLLQESGTPVMLVPAACRGLYHVKALSGADMPISIAPKIAETLEPEAEPFTENIGEPIDEAVISRLKTIPEFCKAYEPDGMRPEQFITFGPVNRTVTQFIESGWNLLESYK